MIADLYEHLRDWVCIIAPNLCFFKFLHIYVCWASRNWFGSDSAWTDFASLCMISMKPKQILFLSLSSASFSVAFGRWGTTFKFSPHWFAYNSLCILISCVVWFTSDCIKTFVKDSFFSFSFLLNYKKILYLFGFSLWLWRNFSRKFTGLVAANRSCL